jgi:mono/diheme cytochrome c family protein
MNEKHILTFGKTTLAIALTAALNLSAFADASKLPPASTKANITFANDIKPIFDTSCVKCHGDEKPKAGLKLTSLETTLKGTKEGKVIEPGDSGKSSLVLSVAQVNSDEDTWMPPKNNKAKIAPLTKEQVGLVRAWVEQGAK